jgi:hypothetical protein
MRTRWWNRPINEKNFGFWGTRAGGYIALIICFTLYKIVSNTWSLVVAVALVVGGLLFALFLRRKRSDGPPSIIK